jgi:hypothetical protein
MACNSVAASIREHLGHKAFFMMAARRFVVLEKGLQFDVRGSERVNRITVELETVELEEESYTYTVKFIQRRRVDTVQVSSYDDIRPVELNPLITQETGLNTSL